MGNSTSNHTNVLKIYQVSLNSKYQGSGNIKELKFVIKTMCFDTINYHSPSPPVIGLETSLNLIQLQ